uniref:Pyridine nucleotide-disulfide oxidoreductase domain-containing protein 2 n=1 Tax=Heterorhabditis bacteriophora TaxID=37862 RepID=A0A1I7WM47_HETBA
MGALTKSIIVNFIRYICYYVLLHHVLGGLDGRTGTWGYVFGGMGTVSNALASAALSHGAELYTNYEVSSILTEDGCVKGVKLANGKEVAANIVLANTTPKITFTDLIEKSVLPQDFRNSINTIDYTSPVTKINVAVRSLPSFSCLPSIDRNPMPHHQTTIHMNCELMQLVHQGVVDYRQGQWSKNPVIEMTIPSAVDRSLVQDDTSHVVSLFTQYTPYKLNDGLWDDSMKEKYATKGIFSLKSTRMLQIFLPVLLDMRSFHHPNLKKYSDLLEGRTWSTRKISIWLIGKLYLKEEKYLSGGGVTGAPGRLGAITALKHWKNSKKY